MNMKTLHFGALLALVAGAILILPTFAQDDTAVLEANLTDECVAEYDENTDYFPDKIDISDAENFAVEYFNHYKVVTVTDAFDGAEPFTYVLTQCGTPAPDEAEFPAGTQFLELPAESTITMSTTQLPHLSDLGLLDTLVGLDSFLFVNNDDVNALIADEALVEIGSGAEVNVELALETEPDVIFTFGFSPDTDAHPVLIEAGIVTALNAEWREATPLGRAEWLKFTALFFNAEATATEVYDGIVTRYTAAADLAAGVPEEERPVVLWNAFTSFSDTWSIPGAETYAGNLIQDAGGVIALGDEAEGISAALSFEAVYEEAVDADVWVLNTFGIVTADDLLAIDERYADFAAVQEGNLWNNDLDVNSNGGYNYFELGVTNPDLILEDLVAIFYPDLLPDHDFNFFRQLDGLEAGE